MFTTIAITATTVIQTVLKDDLVNKTTFAARKVIKKTQTVFITVRIKLRFAYFIEMSFFNEHSLCCFLLLRCHCSPYTRCSIIVVEIFSSELYYAHAF